MGGADVEDLKIVLRAEVEKAVSNLKKGAAAGRSASKDWESVAKTFTKTAKESLSVQKAFGQLTTQVAGGIAIYNLASRTIQGVNNFSKESVAAYEKQSDAVAKLNAILAATGGAVGLSSSELQAYAAELQMMTTIGDESIIEMVGVLGTFTSIQGQTFKDATRLTLDLSTVFRTDLTSAAKQLGKALDDPVKGVSALGEVGITFTAAERKMIASLVEAGKVTEAQALMLDKLEKKVGGAAAALAGDGVGATKQFANAWGDSKELLGQSITDTLEPAYRQLTKFITATNNAVTAKRNLDLVTASSGAKGDSGLALDTLRADIASVTKELEETRKRAEEVGEETSDLWDLGGLDTPLLSSITALENRLDSLKKQELELVAVKKAADEKAAAEKKVAAAAREVAAAEEARLAADNEALDHYKAVDAALKKKLHTMSLEASLSGEQVSLEAKRNAYQEAYIGLIVDSNGRISESNTLTAGYKKTVLELNEALTKTTTNYSPLGDMSDFERLRDLYAQTDAGARAAKAETIAWVEAQRELADETGNSLAIYDAILDDLRGIKDEEADAAGSRNSLLGLDNLHEVKQALEELEADLVSLFDRASMAQGLSDAFASIGESLAESGSAMEGLGRYIQQAAAMMLRQVSTFAFTAGLHVLADGGLAALPLALALFALGGISGLAGGFIGAGSGTSTAIELNYDPVLQAEKELRDQRLELLRETIAEEKRLRQEAINKLDESFDAEYEVLRDLWNRNIVSTDQFTTQSAALRSSRDEAIDEANQPTSAELEQERIEQEKAAMATLRQELYHRLDAGMNTYDSIKGFKSTSFQNDLIAAGNKITSASTLQELQTIAAEFTRISSSMTSTYGVAAFGQGGDFVTSGPRLIMVGDNPGGRERVRVEPISSPNIYGPSGDGGVTIVVNGDVYGIEDLYSRLAAAGRVLERRGRTKAGALA